MQEIMNEIEDIDYITANELATKALPKYTFAEIYSCKSLTRLRELSKFHRISGYSKMNKSELISALEDILTETWRMEQLLFMSDIEMFSAFLEVVNSKELECNTVVCNFLYFFARSGLVEIYFYDNKFIAVVPLELKVTFETLCQNGLIERKFRDETIHNYAEAAVGLYGIISQDEFVEIFNLQNKVATNIDEVFNTLLPHIATESDYCFWDEYIVSAGFEHDDFESAEILLDITQNKPRCILEKSEFLKYCDHSYYEETKYTKILEQYLKSICSDTALAEDVADEICFISTMEADLKDIFSILQSANIVLNDIKEVETISGILMDLHINSKLWSNKGYSVNELHIKLGKGKLIPFNTLTTKAPKIGRNEPCPCGSGKKYKKCCGK